MDLTTLRDDYEVWLYGSQARGDADVHSDVDLLIIGDDPRDVDRLTAQVPWSRVSESFYTWDEIRGMWSYGSLFLEHLRREGHRLRACKVDRDRLSKLLATLPLFTRARVDLDAFRLALAEGETSLAEDGWPDLELRILATVARHAAILACYCLGQPLFSRQRPFEVWGRVAGWDGRDIDEIAAGSVKYRFTPMGDPAWNTLGHAASRWLALMHRLLDGMEDVVDQYETTLRTAA